MTTAPCGTNEKPGPWRSGLFVVDGLESGYGMVNVTVAVFVSPPPLPVMVIVRVPVAALLFTVMVMVDVPAPGAAMDVGLKLRVTLEPVTVPDRLTAELKPPLTAVVMVTFPVPEGETEIAVGDALRVKLGVAPGMVSVTVVVSTVLPEVPVTVMGKVPPAVPGLTVIVMLVLLPAVMGLVVNPMVTPAGWPVADKVIEPEKPPVTALLIVVDPLLPALTETELGDAEMEKPDGAGPLRAVINPAVGLPHPVTRS
jgi:hypothetical protein